jgi:two-component system, NtrC family, sensor histidine kinase HydH
MAARKGNDLLEHALRIAQATGRSQQARLAALLKLAARAPATTAVTIYLPDPDRNALTQRYTPLLPVKNSNCLIPYGEGCAGMAAQTLLPHAVPPAQLHADEPLQGEERAVLALPLLDEERLVAVLALGSSDETVGPEAVERATALFPLISLMLQGVAGEQQAEEERRRLSFLVSLGKLVSTPQPAEALFPEVAKLCTGSGLVPCAVLRTPERNGAAARVFKSCRRESYGILPALLRSEAELSARVLAEEIPCDPPVGGGYHALCTPISSSGGIIGTLTLFGPPSILSPQQAEFAETVAALTSGAIARADSSRQVQRFVSDSDQKLKELSLLYRMSNTMLSTIKLNKLIHLTLTALTSGPAPFFDRAMLFLTNERAGVLVGMLGSTREISPTLSVPLGASDDILSSRWDISEEEMARQRESEFCRMVLGKRLELDSGHNIAAQAVLEKRLIYIPEETGLGGDLVPTGYSTAFAASPLIAHGDAVGAVVVDNALTRSPITQERLRFLQLFTNQAGMAIENSMLYQKIEDANLQLREAQENLLQKERLAAIGEMAAGIAHELKGPLVSIGGFAARLAKKLPQESNEWGHADLIVREVLRLEGILSEILLFSKKSTICYTTCNIAQVVKDSLAMVAPALEEKGIAVSTRFPRQKLVLMGDAQQLKQVFINILLNALDAMENGGRLMIQLTTADLDGKEAVCVKISDTGGGIPLESLNSIFTPFYTTKESGTGLGLPIANRIITNHGGKIQINNTPGQGVEFRVLLPRQW